MVSIIPNAASIAYRTGKAMMEQNGTWEYGLELPQYTLQSEFEHAGFHVIREYTIGAEHALEFLPQKFWLRKAMEQWLKENPTEDDCRQGYLLVTLGEKR
ncbi:MAG: class I SAM-dependent methyltransferase, partial [Butyrivibrio sp.]|nr:class I SAM-dependent methyltransferase [Butyrivibrio sp.]